MSVSPVAQWLSSTRLGRHRREASLSVESAPPAGSFHCNLSFATAAMLRALLVVLFASTCLSQPVHLAEDDTCVATS